MAQFLSGVDCGPTNALKTVSGRLERDYSLHQDRLISTPNVAGPSNHGFKGRTTIPSTGTSATAPRAGQSPFDLSALRHHLSPPPQHVISQPQRGGWADAFVPQQRPVSSSATQRAVSPWHDDYRQHLEGRSTTPNPMSKPYTPEAAPAPWQRPVYPTYQPPVPQPFQPHMPLQTFQPAPRLTQQLAQPEARPSTAPPVQVEPLTESQEILARTARSFVEDVSGANGMLAANPKLAGSKFMTLLKGLSDREVVVKDGHVATGDEITEGAKFVQRENAGVDWAGDFLGTTRPTRQVEAPTQTPTQQSYQPHHWDLWEQQFADQHAVTMMDQRPDSSKQRRKSVHFDEALGSGVPSNLEEAMASRTAVPGAITAWSEDLNDFDEDTFMAYNWEMRTARSPRIGVGALEGWGELQKDWEQFQRAEPVHKGWRGMGTGDQVERYLFQSGNPYSAGVVDAEHFGRESPTFKGVLELEAEVQHDPKSLQAWYSLGLKQQENEREDQAILALSKVVQLDPDYRPAYLALAVSYTNEGELEAANTMLERWIELADGGLTDRVEGKGWVEGQRSLVERLIDMARRNPEEVDAEVQVALGVLFNSSEEYTKGEDCFIAALSARPDDWLLYNRLGATLANSGRSHEAISYYHMALSLHPNFVRALFNLGISYINLAQYPLAAQKILDALRLQHADATEGYTGRGEHTKTSPKGVTSETLWTTLRNACMHMGRQDLVALASKKDLSGFPLDFQTPDTDGRMQA